jgi:P4 family phage/plasmid primase-like protien
MSERGVPSPEAIAELSEGLSPEYSEDALALEFSRRHGDDLRYTARWGQWHRWDGTCWREDQTLNVFDRARAVCRNAAIQVSAETAQAKRLTAASTVAAVERLARSDRRHAAVIEQWDADTWLLNTPAGTVDLRDGKLRAHRREDHISKITAAGPAGTCPLWLRFLDRVTAEDVELQSFLQRVIGYSLTGSTREHALFFLYGTGANGKSVFLSTISKLLGDYAKNAPMSTFTVTKIEQHPTDIAGLRGARLVTSVETEDGSRWAESKIKALTGGDPISARFMRQDFFTFTPEFKLVIAGNHKPSLRSVDEAIRRRLNLVPFTVTIPAEERDPNLPEKLRAEFPGILSWAIEGCLAWQQHGLNPPAVVLNATAEYLAAEDALGLWLEERCTIDRRAWTSSGSLFADWTAWCERSGERAGSKKRFGEQLEARGFQPDKTTGGKRGYIGISLAEDSQ